jgi:mevalonate kinase
MKTIIYTAPAKTILSGEHAVVYGKPALVCALDMRMQVKIRDGNETHDVFKNISLQVRKFLEKRNRKIHSKELVMEVTSDIPMGRGLGSSAALSTAASAAYIEAYTGSPPTVQDVADCAYGVEKMFHSNPSGVDTSSSCFGGLIFFRKEFEFLKTISLLPMKIPQAIGKDLLLIDSGKPEESTSEMVQAVGKLYIKDTARMEIVMSAIEKSVKRMVVAIVKEDRAFFQNSIAQNQAELEKLGVVSEKAKRFLKNLSPFGVGKVTGAGGLKSGSGFMLFHADDRKRAIKSLEKIGIQYMPFCPANQGFEKNYDNKSICSG